MTNIENKTSTYYLKLINQRKSFISKLEPIKSKTSVASSNLSTISNSLSEGLSIDGVSVDNGKLVAYSQDFDTYTALLEELITTANSEITSLQSKYIATLANEKAAAEAAAAATKAVAANDEETTKSSTFTNTKSIITKNSTIS